MNNKTMNTVSTLLDSFHNTWHLPILELINHAWRDRTPEALLSAAKQAEQGIDALMYLQEVVERLVKRDGSMITPEEAWHVANDLEELACSLQYITVELGELAIQIAEKYALT
ncbi:hypothetical protein [Enterobacter cloacae]|uniref:hypothetical protein n=1 Tax=Enterobacter cloacae TaxID=550 RepID=UPI000BDA71C0|nr:hypothetical protein [Enterobacter cloacae]PCM83563.1 hypothetical protein CP903_00500 [Enterobacter cloacae]